jgi:hypothetical protein
VVREKTRSWNLRADWAPLIDIRVDEKGDAMVLQKGSVHRHGALLVGEELALPCGVVAVRGLPIKSIPKRRLLYRRGGRLLDENRFDRGERRF